MSDTGLRIDDIGEFAGIVLSGEVYNKVCYFLLILPHSILSPDPSTYCSRWKHKVVQPKTVLRSSIYLLYALFVRRANSGIVDHEVAHMALVSSTYVGRSNGFEDCNHCGECAREDGFHEMVFLLS